MISDNRRISTSSQTCYQDTVKILYPRTLHKTYAMVQEKKTEGFKNFYLNFAKLLFVGGPHSTEVAFWLLTQRPWV